jgi:hypothetical protein
VHLGRARPTEDFGGLDYRRGVFAPTRPIHFTPCRLCRTRWRVFLDITRTLAFPGSFRRASGPHLRSALGYVRPHAARGFNQPIAGLDLDLPVRRQHQPAGSAQARDVGTVDATVAGVGGFGEGAHNASIPGLFQLLERVPIFGTLKRLCHKACASVP